VGGCARVFAQIVDDFHGPLCDARVGVHLLEYLIDAHIEVASSGALTPAPTPTRHRCFFVCSNKEGFANQLSQRSDSRRDLFRLLFLSQF